MYVNVCMSTCMRVCIRMRVCMWVCMWYVEMYVSLFYVTDWWRQVKYCQRLIAGPEAVCCRPMAECQLCTA